MKKYNINHYSMYTNIKASVVERFNKTLKEKMWKQFFSIQGIFKWIDILPKLVHSYNHTYHNTIKMKPVDINLKNQEIVYYDVFRPNESLPIKPPKYRVGDHARVSKIKGTFEKGYTAN
jgi:hypothetical protein